MKAKGLGNSYHTINHSINHFVIRFFEFFILACWFLSTNNLSSIHPRELARLAFAQFDPEMPGFQQLLPKIKEPGFAFELETALIFAHKHEKVIGFDLDLTFLHQQEFIYFDGQTQELRTTEFDIVTENFAVECKCIKHPHNKNLPQFIKEKNLLIWCKELAKNIAEEKVAYSFTTYARTKPVVIITCPATNGQAIPITSSWLTASSAEGCIEQFKDIILLLSTKYPTVFFSRPVSNEFALKLRDLNISFVDDVSLRTKGSYNDINSLTGQLAAASIN